MTAPENRVAHMSGGGASLVLAGVAVGEPLPVILHWGAELGPDLDAAGLSAALEPRVSWPDVPVRRRLLPMPVDGWRHRPGLRGARPDGTGWSPRFLVRSVEGPDGAGTLTIRAGDDAEGLELELTLVLHPSGVLEIGPVLRNKGPGPYAVTELAATLPLPVRAAEVLDLTGRWVRERVPQRHALPYGTWSRESRHGRTGHDAPLLFAVGVPGFTFRTGEVWSAHLGWSGDSVHWAERGPDAHAGLGTAELLAPGEVVLEPGEEYAAPATYAAYSARGLDGLSEAFHAMLRARPGHPSRPRPVGLNVWEAVYFDHRLDRLLPLADLAAQIGVERYVLDDGWFRHRRDDTAGLGDWYVDEQVWPDGLTPLIEHVRGLGMEFGLWVEPEMVNEDSDLYRAHPDWVLAVPGRLPPPWRHQQVLNVAHPDAYAYLLERLDALLTENDVGYVKWDHNRDLIEAAHDGRAGVHAQTLAVYRLLDELRARHPGVEIESCSSGGGRVDLGILQRTDRVWTSDSNDALDRQSIQRWTEQVLPPELVGAHVGAGQSHTTGRVHALSFRIATAFFGHFGLEWDITATSPEEQEALAEAIAAYKELRGLLHTGTVVRADHPDPTALLHGVVARDTARALFAYVQLNTSALESPGPVQFPGVDPDRSYRVRPLLLAGGPELGHGRAPDWFTNGGLTASGRTLGTVGLVLPQLQPEHALLLQLTSS